MDAPCSSHEGGELGGDAVRGQGEVPVEVEVERRVQEDRSEAGPLRGLLGLGPPAVPLPLETRGWR